jgi:uncharacterized membrane protein YuzA (DUF378 family)
MIAVYVVVGIVALLCLAMTVAPCVLSSRISQAEERRRGRE